MEALGLPEVTGTSQLLVARTVGAPQALQLHWQFAQRPQTAAKASTVSNTGRFFFASFFIFISFWLRLLGKKRHCRI